MDYDINELPAKLVERITVDANTGCWIVSNPKQRGETPSEYRSIYWRGHLWQAHVLAYELLVGEYDVQLDLDHVQDRGCRSKACCYPGHLEPVTRRENHLRRVRSRPAQTNPSPIPTGM
jgi:hypothetical protein